MVQIQDILSVFDYLNEIYNLTDGIYVQLKNSIPAMDYIWTVEGSNLTFKFTNIEQFHDAYTDIVADNCEIEHIIYKSNFIHFKYYPTLSRVFVSTESFHDISHLHDILNQQGVKEIVYKFKNMNN
jgi:hypothetical protein